MNLNVNIQLGSDTMSTPWQIAEALELLAIDMRNNTAGDPHTPIKLGPFDSCAGNLRDDNGNRVGSWSVKA